MAWPWLPVLRETLRRHVVDAHAELAQTSPPGGALDLLQHAVTVDPLNEDLHRRVEAALTNARITLDGR